MSAHDPFLSAIAADPEQDGPRLRYADWLEENGDPDRAAFIRLQCAAARLPEDDPETDRFVRRATDLLHRHGIAWLAPVRVAVGDLSPQPQSPEPRSRLGRLLRRFRTRTPPSSVGWMFRSWNSPPAEAVFCRSAWIARGRLQAEEVRFRRGLLEDVELVNSYEGAGEELARLAQAVPLLRLRLRLSRDSLVWRHIDGPHCETLRELRLTGRYPYESGLERPSVFPAVVRDVIASPHLPRLESLHLWLPDAGTDAVNLLAASPLLGRLRRLRLSASFEAVRLLARSPGCRGLVALDLANYRLSGEALPVLAESPHLAGLRELRLAHTPIDDAGVAALAASPHLTRLTSLDLFSGAFGPAGMEALVASPNAAHLVSLDLGADFSQQYQPVSPFGDAVTALANSPHLRNLRVLRLARRGVTDAGFAALVRSPHLPALEEFHLPANEITDAGLIALAESPEAARLRRVVLLGNRIGEAGVRALMQSPYLANLRRLRLGEVNIDPQLFWELDKCFGDRVVAGLAGTYAAQQILAEYLHRPR